MDILTIKWRKLKDNAVLPTKTDAAAGYDIYTNEVNEVLMQPHEKRLFSTGLAYTLDKPNYWLMVFDRGSTGSRGLHVHCGVCDNDYRGEIFVCISNDNPYPVKFTNLVNKPTLEGNTLHYPLSKAIAQIIPVAMPLCLSIECSDDEWKKSCEQSLRGEGKLGSSGK